MNARRHLGALAAVTALGLWLRAQGLSDVGLWRDDAWVALTSRVAMSRAWRMGVTAPGFTFVERAWILVHPGSARWAQLLPLALGVVGIVAMYALARQFQLSEWWSVGCAAVVAVSPVAIMWSVHVKQYSTDLLSSCLLLGLGEHARRTRGRLPLVWLGLASVATLAVSASVVPIVVGVWVSLAVVAVREPARRVPIVVAGGVTAAGCAAFAVVALSDLPTALSRYWSGQGRFISVASVGGFGRGAARAAGALSLGLVHWPSPLETVGAVVLVGLVVVGASTSRAALAPASAIVLSFVAAAASVIPLGTGRTDEVLYPAVIVVAALGLRWSVDVLDARLSSASGRAHRVAGLAAVALLAFVAVAELVGPVRYPSVDVQRVASVIATHRRPGDVVYVDARTRYPWALVEQPRVDVRFGRGWGSGFTVKSTQPGVLISPSQSWERPFAPWSIAARVPVTARVWFVGSGQLSDDVFANPDYRALVARGWRLRWSYQAPGAYTLLLDSARMTRSRAAVTTGGSSSAGTPDR